MPIILVELFVFCVLCGATLLSQWRVKSIFAALGYAVANFATLASVALALLILGSWWGWTKSNERELAMRREMVVSSREWSVEWIDKQGRWWVEEVFSGTHRGRDIKLSVPLFNPEWRAWALLSVWAGLSASFLIFFVTVLRRALGAVAKPSPARGD